MPRRLTRRAAILGAAALAAGCRPLRTFPFDSGSAEDPGELTVRFFSVACFLVEFDGLAILTDPFFTHLPLGQVASGTVLADPRAVDPHRPLLGAVRGLLIGHGHYDHCLGLPAVAGDVHAGAQVLAGRTVAHTFAPNRLPIAIQPINEIAATTTHPGRWIDLVPGRLRVLPIASGHPDNIPGVHLFQKRLTEDRATPPHRAHHYQEGDTFAFVVDWLVEGVPAWRLYIQTSSRGLPDGAVPAAVLAERPVDVALLAMDCARAEASGRTSIQDVLRPRTVFFCHYGDFFRPKDRPPWEGVKVNLRRLHRLLDDVPGRRVLYPAWGSVFRLSRES